MLNRPDTSHHSDADARPAVHGAALADRLARHVRAPWTTRYAPAPTGWLHLGHAVNAVFVWGLARALGGRVLLRLEDHDAGRCRADYERGILDDLDWLGLVPDAGRTDEFRAGPHALRQSDRGASYAAALSRVAAHGLVYPCACSRRDIAAHSGDAFGEESPYPGTCRARGVEPSSTFARRVRLTDAVESFDDIARGTQSQHPATQCGDVLVRDRAGSWTYQFAVSVDDAEQEVDVVIRGADLLASTGRQIALARLLGRATPPAFLHHPLIMRADGAKLSKSDGDTGLRDLRAAGWSAERVLGHAAFLGGLVEREREFGAPDLASLFR